MILDLIIFTTRIIVDIIERDLGMKADTWCHYEGLPFIRRGKGAICLFPQALLILCTVVNDESTNGEGNIILFSVTVYGLSCDLLLSTVRVPFKLGRMLCSGWNEAPKKLSSCANLHMAVSSAAVTHRTTFNVPAPEAGLLSRSQEFKDATHSPEQHCVQLAAVHQLISPKACFGTDGREGIDRRLSVSRTSGLCACLC
ncbi:hypothetical protein CEXT_285231 [Caerostris extrusa]|uniref:Uncharacterized protein n=1 Tax=Caerostris extrusa TaxID=172846 RepID=A0AAV4V951_CAEEX|nr:hypothetical protein CEXT_285231 [Caerostris extrusa]